MTAEPPNRARCRRGHETEGGCSDCLALGRAWCLRAPRCSYPGVVLDVLLEFRYEFGGEGAPGSADGVPDVAGGHLLLAAFEHDALERQLRGPAGGELDVRRGEQPRLLHDRGLVQLAVRDRGEVAVPYRLSRGRVGRADGNDVVEPAVPQERAVQGADRVRGADEQALILLPERRDELEDLVGDTL